MRWIAHVFFCLAAALSVAVPGLAVPARAERVVNVYIAERKPGERFLDAYRRLGMAKFKEAAYEPDKVPA